MVTFGQNIYLLIGLAIVLGTAGVLLVGVWIGARAWVWHLRQARARRQWGRDTRRADGQMYPPYGEGACQRCGRGSRRIYHPPCGARLCPSCYEQFWRYEERVPPANAGSELFEPLVVAGGRA
ncbi:MAG: hypothetical protein GY778_28620 [bacterium]|nr:hypothetical protein [bacterium]